MTEQQGATTAVATKRKEQIAALRSMLGVHHAKLEKMLPAGMSAARFGEACIYEGVKIPQLLEASPASWWGAILTAAGLGLEPGIGGQCYFIPFMNNKKNVLEVQFIPGYMGLAQLAYRSGKVSVITADVVHEKDQFEFTTAPPDVRHTRCAEKERGEFICAYAGYKNNLGHWNWEVMQAWEIEAVMARSKAAQNKSGPWHHPQDKNEMRKKTPFRRLRKYMPWSTHDNALARAVALDDQADMGLPQALEVEADNVEVVETGGEG